MGHHNAGPPSLLGRTIPSAMIGFFYFPAAALRAATSASSSLMRALAASSWACRPPAAAAGAAADLDDSVNLESVDTPPVGPAALHTHTHTHAHASQHRVTKHGATKRPERGRRDIPRLHGFLERGFVGTTRPLGSGHDRAAGVGVREDVGLEHLRLARHLYSAQRAGAERLVAASADERRRRAGSVWVSTWKETGEIQSFITR
jgi:hypothetical protein